MNIYSQTILAFAILGFSAFFCLVIAYLASDAWRKEIDKVGKG